MKTPDPINTNLLGAIKSTNTTSTVTISVASPAIITWTAHGLSNGNTVYFTTTGTLPTGLSTFTRYYIQNKTTDTFQVSTTVGGTAINTSGAGSGTHTGYAGGLNFSGSQPVFGNYDTGNGNGATNTKVRRMSTFRSPVTGSGMSDFTFTDDSAAGSAWTINNPGVYAMTYCDRWSGSTDLGITVNSTSAPGSLDTTNLLAVATTPGGLFESVTAIAYLKAADVIRCTNDASGTPSTSPNVMFRIVRIG